MSFCWIAIDIGKFGGIVFESKTDGLALHQMPLKKDGSLDILRIYKLFNFFKPHNCHVSFEKLQGIFGTSKKSTWGLAEQVGQLKAVLTILKLPYTEIPPKVWQHEMYKGIETFKRQGLGGKDKTEIVNDTKERAYWCFLREFKNVPVPKGPRGRILDGQIDAALICRYAQRMKLR